MDEREAKLPRWAKDLISDLRNDIRNKEYLIAELRPEPADNQRIWLNPSSSDIPVGHHHEYDRIKFDCEDDPSQRNFRYIDVSLRNDNFGEGWYLRVQGGETLRIEPQASNVIKVFLK